MKKTEKYYDLALQEAGKYFNYTVKSIEKIISAGHKLMLWLLAFNAFLIKDIALGNPMSFLSILFFCLLPFSLYVFYNLYQCLFVPKDRAFDGIEPEYFLEYSISKKEVLEIYKIKSTSNNDYLAKTLKYYNRARLGFIVVLCIFLIAIIIKFIVWTIF